MRRALLHVLAWSLATGAAATLSWWGVHTVMAGTAYDPPRALPITAARADAQRTDPPPPPPTRRPETSPAPVRKPTPSADPTPARTRPASPPPPPSTAPSGPASGAPSGSGQVKAYDTAGGRAVFDLEPSTATLVSATPGAGWSMQVWKTETWIRVEFTSGADRVSVICAWHDGPPHVDVGTY
ncbi:hypothetical protein [Streptomyces sp. NPDC046985]|uniref:hypothetical protein n=1 Tax=Streptomyces sp. NPDC046985 TaxID=3155377 RepID=UPI0033D854AD